MRLGAQQLLAHAVEAEVETFLNLHSGLATAEGHRRLVRHGYLPERSVQTGIGAVPIKQPRVRDRSDEDVKIRFNSSIVPKYARRSRSLDALIPALYLSGISSGNFQEALAALLGKDAPNLSPAVLRKLKADWRHDLQTWQRRDLSARRYVYIWADGVYLQARMETEKQSILVIIGATPEGKKELVGFQAGYRDSTQSWRELLVDLKKRGLTVPPELAVGDGALGFWKALEEEFGTTKHQRCWVHKTHCSHKSANILNKMPKSIQSKARLDLKEIWLAASRADAEKAMDKFAAKYGTKYDKATECLTKDSTALLAFYDYPAEHWNHVRIANPIESTFASVRHRTVKTRGYLSLETAEIMVFKLIMAAQKQWLKLNGKNQLPKLIQGIKFTDGIEADTEIQAAA